MKPFNWSCPYCDRAQTVSENRHHELFSVVNVGDCALGGFGIYSQHIACSNPQCRGVFSDAKIVAFRLNNRGHVEADHSVLHARKQLMPDIIAKPVPKYIPSAIVEDYQEACKVKDLSPKASATLARRCIQGMIRDFCGLSRPTLFAEIEALRQMLAEGQAPKGVSEESIEAIHHVREVGNIGAHMQKDISIIVSVDENEAQLMISLIETLFEEWYIAREKRRIRFEQVKTAASNKKAQIDSKKGA